MTEEEIKETLTQAADLQRRGLPREHLALLQSLDTSDVIQCSKLTQIAAMVSLAWAYSANYRLDDALLAFDGGKALAEQINAEYWIAEAELGKGRTNRHKQPGHIETAYYQSAQRRFLDLKAYHDAGRCSLFLACARLWLTDYDGAKASLEYADELLTVDPYHRGFYYSYRGLWKEKTGETGIDDFKRAIAMFASIGNAFEAAVNQNNVAQALLNRNRIAEAESNLATALPVLKNSVRVCLFIGALETMQSIKERSGQAEAAAAVAQEISDLMCYCETGGLAAGMISADWGNWAEVLNR